MLSKEILAFLLLSMALCGGVIITCLSQRARDACFVMLIFLAPISESYDVNFVSRDWYRGTVRGFELSLVDVFSISLLISSVLAPRQGRSRLYWVPSLGLLLLFLFYSAFTVAISTPKLWGLFELSKMLRGLVIVLAVALYMRSERELRLFILGWALIVCYQGLLAIEQRYRFGIHRVFGTLVEANSLSFFFCTTTPVLIAAFNARIPTWLKGFCVAGVALACIGVVLTISRAGIVAYGLVLAGSTLATMSYNITFRKLAIALVALIGVAAIVGKSWQTLSARFAESTLEQEYGNKRVQGRGYYIRIATTIAQTQPFGVGLNNWSYWVSNKYGPRLGYRFVPYKGTDLVPSEFVPADSNVDMAQAAPAHNLAALTLGELGYPG
ncbi:MAG TPA: O-antigen ligase family protein, partial [Clostridia bacterium]|nr:O-antigen ligase family protein [Clostridia bacterium]